MSGCQAQLAGVSNGIASALRGVDCLAAETTAMAFGRLFGSGGALLPVLTIVMTLYVAFFALSLLTGRSTLGLSALTPRMMTLGLVLTFATSWVAYQGVVWNLAVGGPDQIAGLLMGTTGSATQMFADRIDIVFAAIAEAAKSAGGGENAAAAGTFTPPNLVWLAAILLLLGTVGILVTARIALAVLIALGPIFVIFALFPGTRGLFAGWLRGVVLLAIAPLFAVLCGGLTLELAVPVIAALRGPEGIDGRSAMALFLIGAVHVSLMSMVMKVAGTMVAGWKVFGMAGTASESTAVGAAAGANSVQIVRDGSDGQAAAAGTAPSRRALGIAPAAVHMPANDTHDPVPQRRDTRLVTHVQASGEPAAAVHSTSRARGIGSRFRAAPARSKEMLR